MLGCFVLIALTAQPSAASEPSAQPKVFYNARIALRDDRPADVLKLWLLRNGLVDQGNPPAVEDDELKSAVWVALGDLSLCQDGFPKDAAGAGLWPVALHNWVVNAVPKGPAHEFPNP